MKSLSKNTSNDMSDIQTEYFIRMMLPSIKKIANPYISEEEDILTSLISSMDCKKGNNLIVVGAGSLSYIEIALKYKLGYVAIEPLIDWYIQQELFYILKQNPDLSFIKDEFGAFSPSELANGHNIFSFIFNVFAYIEDGIEKLNKYIKPGDLIFISTWNLSNQCAKDIRDKYFQHIHDAMNYKLIPDALTHYKSSNFNNFKFDKLTFYQNHQRIIKGITDSLIIEC